MFDRVAEVAGADAVAAIEGQARIARGDDARKATVALVHLGELVDVVVKPSGQMCVVVERTATVAAFHRSLMRAFEDARNDDSCLRDAVAAVDVRA